MLRKTLRFALIVAALIGWGATAHGAVVLLQPGPEGKDINIADGQLAGMNLSFASPWLISAWSPGPAGRPRSAGLIEFDLAALGGLSVQSALTTMNASPLSPHFSFGTPITAASATSGSANSTFSTSAG